VEDGRTFTPVGGSGEAGCDGSGRAATNPVARSRFGEASPIRAGPTGSALESGAFVPPLATAGAARLDFAGRVTERVPAMHATPSAFARRAFHGITPGYVGILVAFLAFANLFSLAVAWAPNLGLDIGDTVEVFVRLFAGNVVRCTSAAVLGVVAWNLVTRPFVLRVAAALTAVGATTWVTQQWTRWIEDAAYAKYDFFDRASYEFTVLVNDSGTAAIAVALAVLFVRDGENTRALHRQRLRVLDLDRGLAEARLRVAQAQIEPHFLFNTLANVRRLYDVDRNAGSAMLRHFKGVLERALPAMRERKSTLAQEVAHASAYLNVQQIRMGRRLAFAFDVPDDLRAAAFPPMMLLTLVENAVKHGLAPLPQGGSVRVEARRDRGVLTVRVVDTGRGFHGSTSGSGIGLANVEARLRAAFGNDGRLLLEENPQGGVTAAIEVPA